MKKHREKDLKEVLGSSYGGPSISIKKDKFIIYTWYDAPVGEEILAEGFSLEELLSNYEKRRD